MRVTILMLAALLTVTAMPGAHAQTGRVPRPSPGLAPDPASGKALYEAHCAKCHGLDLRGTKTGPPLLHRVYLASHHSDIAFQLAAKYGTRQHHWTFGDMAPVAAVTPDDVAHITAYVRDAQRKAGIR